MDELKKLCIKANNTAANEACFICGERTDPRVPYDIFPIISYCTVCSLCQIKYAPKLIPIVEELNRVQNEMQTEWNAND